jgi:hypothetical protein
MLMLEFSTPQVSLMVAELALDEGLRGLKLQHHATVGAEEG